MKNKVLPLCTPTDGDKDATEVVEIKTSVAWIRDRRWVGRTPIFRPLRRLTDLGENGPYKVVFHLRFERRFAP